MTNPTTDLIRVAALAAGAAYFVHETATQATLDDSQPTPQVLLYDFPTGSGEASSRVERADITLYFATNKDGAGDNPGIEGDAVQRMRVLKERFLAVLDGNPLLEITGIKDTPFHNAWQAQFTGVGVQFALTVPRGEEAIC